MAQIQMTSNVKTFLHVFLVKKYLPMVRPRETERASIVHMERMQTLLMPIAAPHGATAPLGHTFLLTLLLHSIADATTAKQENIRQPKTASLVSDGEIVYLGNIYARLAQRLPTEFVNYVLMEDIPC